MSLLSLLSFIPKHGVNNEDIVLRLASSVYPASANLLNLKMDFQWTCGTLYDHESNRNVCLGNFNNFLSIFMDLLSMNKLYYHFKLFKWCFVVREPGGLRVLS